VGRNICIRIDTPDYTQEILKQYSENWFFVNEAQVVRELKNCDILHVLDEYVYSRIAVFVM